MNAKLLRMARDVSGPWNGCYLAWSCDRRVALATGIMTEESLTSDLRLRRARRFRFVVRSDWDETFGIFRLASCFRTREEAEAAFLLVSKPEGPLDDRGALAHGGTPYDPDSIDIGPGLLS